MATKDKEQTCASRRNRGHDLNSKKGTESHGVGGRRKEETKVGARRTGHVKGLGPTVCGERFEHGVSKDGRVDGLVGNGAGRVAGVRW